MKKIKYVIFDTGAKFNIKADKELIVPSEKTKKRIDNAIAYFANDCKYEEVIALYDTTRFGSGKKGILFTERGYYQDDINFNVEDKISLPVLYDEIKKISTMKPIEDDYYKIFLRSGIKKLYGGAHRNFIATALTNILNALTEESSTSKAQAAKPNTTQASKASTEQVEKPNTAQTARPSVTQIVKQGEIQTAMSLHKAGEVAMTRDHKKALDNFRKAADFNYLPSVKSLALAYQNKVYELSKSFHGMEYDAYCVLALYWLGRRKDLGDASAEEAISDFIKRYPDSTKAVNILSGCKAILKCCKREKGCYLIDGVRTDIKEIEFWEDKVREAEGARNAESDREKIEKNRQERGQELYNEGIALYTQNADKDTYATGLRKLEQAANLGNNKATVFILQQKAESGDADAEYKLGKAYKEGALGLELNAAEGFSWFEKSASHGNKDAMWQAAQCLSRGIGTAQNTEKAAKIYTALAKEGYPRALLLYGETCSKGEAADVQKAEYFLLPLTKLDYTNNRENAEIVRDAWHALAVAYNQCGKASDIHENLLPALKCAFNFARVDILKNEIWDVKYRPAQRNMLYSQIDLAEKEHEGALKELILYYAGKYLRFRTEKKQKFKEYYEDIHKIFILEAVRRCMPDAMQGKVQAFIYLYDLYTRIENKELMRYWAFRAIDAEDTDTMFVVGIDYREYGVSESDATELLYRAAELGNIAAKDELRARAENEEYQRKNMESMRKYVEAQEREKRETAIKEEMEKYRRKIDLAERDIDLMLGGSGSTMEEKLFKGEISESDCLNYDIIRSKLEQRHENNLNDL